MLKQRELRELVGIKSIKYHTLIIIGASPHTEDAVGLVID